MKNKHGRIKEKRNALWNENSHCCYCGCETILPENLPEEYFTINSNGLLQQTQPLPDNTATIEHLYSKLNPLRRKKSGVLLLSCYKCNQEQSRNEISKLQKELWTYLSSIDSLKERMSLIEQWQNDGKVCKIQ